jgi:LysM repeat protein
MISSKKAIMKPWKRLSFYLLLNVIVSALTTWVVITIWDQAHPQTIDSTKALVEVTLESQQATMIAAQDTSAATNTESLAGFSTQAGGILPTQAVEEYQVSADDTLGEIAARYGLSVDEILQFNQLKDPNALSVGMVIYIPVTPEVQTTDTPAVPPTRAPQITGSPQAGISEARVVINSVIGVGDLTSERVFLSRTNGGVLLLDGWKLKDQDGNEFVFPYLELFQGGAVNVWTTQGTPTVVDLYWGLQYPVWKSGETVTLVDGTGKVQATYKIP